MYLGSEEFFHYQNTASLTSLPVIEFTVFPNPTTGQVKIEVEDNGNEIINRTWSVIDNSGNQTAGIQKIYIEDIVPPYIFCPSDISVNNDNCSPSCLFTE